jgi:sortase A
VVPFVFILIMKKFILIFLLAVGLVLIGAYNKFSNANNESVEPKIGSSSDSGHKRQSEEINIGLPVKLSIPDINVSASVEYVGLDSKRNMDVPKNDMNVAWYNLGPKPGEQGSAVMAGHLDRASGGPAVFWDLEKIEEGDEIKVTDENGKVSTFRVTGMETYPFDEFPLQEVFADKSGKKLNLITCDGDFDQATKNYSQRTVVYSELSE